MARPKQRLPMPPTRVGAVLDSSAPSSDSTARIKSTLEKEERAHDLNSCLKKPKNWLEEWCEEKSESPVRNNITTEISDVGADVGIEDFDGLGDFEFGDQKKLSNSDAAEVLDFDPNADIGAHESALELSSDEGIPEVEETFICTTCGHYIDVCNIQRHPQLGVGICKNCKIFLYSGPFTKDLDGYEEQCRWCGQGGDVVLCDKCDKAFCKLCIVHNFGAKMHARILKKKEWKCFLCNPEPLKELVIAYEKLKKNANPKSKGSSSESDQTLEDALNKHKTVNDKPSGRSRGKVWPEWKCNDEQVNFSIGQTRTCDLEQEHPKVKEKTNLCKKLNRTEKAFETKYDIANYPITTLSQPENKRPGKSVRNYLRPHMLKRRR